MNKKLIIIASIGFLLSACQSSPQVELDLNQPLDQLPVKSIACNDLKTEAYRAQCEERLSAVAGQILADEVIKTFDLKRCDHLSYDKIESCKNQLQSTGVQGPLSLEQVEVLQKAMQPVLPMNQEILEAMPPAEQRLVQLEYKLDSCQNLPTENGLKSYCEAQVKEKIEFQQLKSMMRDGDEVNCKEFKVERVLQECERF